MRLPTPLLRKNKLAHKNTFGHVGIVAGSASMLGAAALTGLSALRSGSGLVTIAAPKSLNNTLQKKIVNPIMTIPLESLKFKWDKFQALAIGPGLGQSTPVKKIVHSVIQKSQAPLIIDADALNALVGKLELLTKTDVPKVLTPHLGEFARLLNCDKKDIEQNKRKLAKEFCIKYNVHLILKGYQSLVVDPQGKASINKTGNVGMATAGSGDVLTGMLASFIGQGIDIKKAAKTACHLHGLAGDLAAQDKTKVSLIASDIIDYIPVAIQEFL